MNDHDLIARRAQSSRHIALALCLIGTASVAEDAGPVADWSGSYAGLTLGLTHSDGAAELGAFAGDLLTLDVQNGLFPAEIDGAQATGIAGLGVGFNWQRGRFIAGLEADLSFQDHAQSLAFSRVDPNPNPMFNGLDTNTRYATEFGNLKTLRLRGGYVQGRTLFFATGGLAAASVRNDFALDLPGLGYSSPDWSESGTLHGYVFGIGLERRITQRVSLKAEVMRFDLADVTVDARDPVTFPGESVAYKFDNAGTLARIGVNIAF